MMSDVDLAATARVLRRLTVQTATQMVSHLHDGPAAFDPDRHERYLEELAALAVVEGMLKAREGQP